MALVQKLDLEMPLLSHWWNMRDCMDHLLQNKLTEPTLRANLAKDIEAWVQTVTQKVHGKRRIQWETLRDMTVTM